MEEVGAGLEGVGLRRGPWGRGRWYRRGLAAGGIWEEWGGSPEVGFMQGACLGVKRDGGQECGVGANTRGVEGG